ncbi:hypothetical protein YC2023_015828 [Brassica napus]
MWIRIDHPHNISCIPYTFDSLSISLLSKKKTLTKVKAENELMLSRFEQLLVKPEKGLGRSGDVYYLEILAFLTLTVELEIQTLVQMIQKNYQ